MGVGLEVIAGNVTNPGAVFTPWTMNTGNSNQVRSAAVTAPVKLLAGWAMNATAGTLRVRSPRLHDFQQGIRMRVIPSYAGPLFPAEETYDFSQNLVPQDTLTIEQTGGGAEIDTGALMIYYAQLPGIAARFIGAADVQKFGQNIIGQEVAVTTTATGNWSGQVAINSAFDNFKANTDYALLGGLVDNRVLAVRVQGVDTGNLGVGIPGEPTLRGTFSNWFQRLSDATGYNLVPVFNSANKTGILVDAAAPTIVTATITLFMVELAQGSVPGAQSQAAA